MSIMPQCIRRVLLLLLYVRLRVLCISRWSSCGKLLSEMRMERWLQIFSCSGSRGWWWCSLDDIVSVLFISRRHTDTGSFSPAVQLVTKSFRNHSNVNLRGVFFIHLPSVHFLSVFVSYTCFSEYAKSDLGSLECLALQCALLVWNPFFPPQLTSSEPLCFEPSVLFAFGICVP